MITAQEDIPIFSNTAFVCQWSTTTVTNGESGIQGIIVFLLAMMVQLLLFAQNLKN